MATLLRRCGPGAFMAFCIVAIPEFPDVQASEIAAGASDWRTALQYALASEPRVVAAQAMVSSQVSEVAAARASYYPTVSGIGSLGDVVNYDDKLRDGSKGLIGVEVSQPVPIFGHEKALVETAESGLQVEELEVLRVREEVLLEIVDASVRTRLTGDLVAAHRRLEDNLSRQVALLRESVRGGGADLAVLGIANADLIEAAAHRVTSEATFSGARTRLAGLVPGASPDVVAAGVTANALSAFLPRDLAGALDRGRLASVPVRQARAELGRAEAERDLANVERYPRLSVDVSAQTGTFGDASADAHSIFLNLNAPLYEGGARVARAEAAAFRYQSALDSLAGALRSFEQDVTSIWARWASLQSAAAVWKDAELQQEDAYRWTSEQVAGGSGTIIAALRAEQAVLEARVYGLEQDLERELLLATLMHRLGLLELLIAEDGAGASG